MKTDKCCPMPYLRYEDEEGPIENNGITSGLAQREKLGHADEAIVSSKLGNGGKDEDGYRYPDRGGNDAGSVF